MDELLWRVIVSNLDSSQIRICIRNRRNQHPLHSLVVAQIVLRTLKVELAESPVESLSNLYVAYGQLLVEIIHLRRICQMTLDWRWCLAP